MTLQELQQALAASLVRGAEPPAGCDPALVRRARRSLVRKRREAVQRLLPRLWQALGAEADTRFGEHSRRYQPSSGLIHVDDAWQFAVDLATDTNRRVRVLAHDELVRLRLLYVRKVRPAGNLIRERSFPAIGLLWGPPRRLVWRWNRRS